MKARKIGLIMALIAGVMLAYSPALRAQDTNAKDGKDTKTRQGRDGRGGQEYINKMKQDLKLTDEQATKVETLMKEQREKMRGMRDLSEEQRREKFKTMREEMDKKMKEILTADQYTQWEKERQQRGPGGPGGQKRGPRKGGDDKK